MSNRRLAGGGAIAAVIALAGCGSSGSAHASRWGTLKLSSGATLPYPVSWRRIGGDTGTASAALFNSDGTIRAYLNITPAIPQETLSGWAHFRLAHNADEGDRHVTLLSRQTNIRLGGGRSSCVTDQYTTTRTSYRETACVVASGGVPRTVLVEAAQPGAWSGERQVFQYALDHFTS